MNKLSIAEIFGPTFQGEGESLGHPAVFIRVAGCPLRCKWCDTPYAQKVTSGVKKTIPAIVNEVLTKVGDVAIDAIITGGEPTMFDCGELLLRLKAYGFRVVVESAAWSCPDWIREVDAITLSPKPPSSGHATAHAALRPYHKRGMPAVTIKVVVDTFADLSYAQDIAAEFGRIVYVQPCYTITEAWDVARYFKKMEWLVREIQKARWWKLIPRPQLHRCLYGNQSGV